MPPSLSQLAKGHQFPPSSFDLSPAWVEEYVAAVEDEAIGRLGQGLVPPTAVAALAIRALLEAAELPPGAIHLGQELFFQRPVRIGDRLCARAQVGSRGERQGWILMRIDLTVEDEGRNPVLSGRATLTMPVSPREGA